MSFFDFGSIDISRIELPYDDRKFIKASYKDEKLKGYEAIMIEDSLPSKVKDGKRLSTIIGRFPRIILSEVNTHRVFSRNSASSRARSVRSTLTSVLDEPFIPLFTSNKKGMSGDFLTGEKYEQAKELWLEARDNTVNSELRLLLGDFWTDADPISEGFSERAKDLIEVYYSSHYNVSDSSALNVHKQNANRLIEPFSWHESVISSTDWDNFLYLRTNLETAQPEIYAFALLVEAILEESTPVDSIVHLPFVSAENKSKISGVLSEDRPLLMMASSEAAQVSYKDKGKEESFDENIDLERKKALGERLLEMNHMSPFEHIAYSSSGYENLGLEKSENSYKSNFDDSWIQLRSIVEKKY